MTNEYTISIVSHGHGDMLLQLLGDLASEPTLAGARVIVTLNLKSEDFDETVFRNLQLTILRNETPLGFGANHNRAFQYCQTPWFVVLNPDLRLAGHPPFDSLLACARQHANVGVVAPLVVSSKGETEDSVRWNLTPWSLVSRHLFGRRDVPIIESPAQPGQTFRWLAGMCMMIDSAAFRSLGGFDERYFLYCEDYDLCARLYNTGHKVIVDTSSRVIHDAQRGSHRSRRYLYWHVSSLLRVWTSGPFWRIVLQAREDGVSR
jgi:N-acetylglucosaminyl-diphospho-decaprenol L-rhamnosyltransferase